MYIQFKVNTGIVKTGKNSQTRFNEDDLSQLQKLEQNNFDLFVALLRNKIKHFI